MRAGSGCTPPRADDQKRRESSPAGKRRRECACAPRPDPPGRTRAGDAPRPRTMPQCRAPTAAAPARIAIGKTTKHEGRVPFDRIIPTMRTWRSERFLPAPESDRGQSDVRRRARRVPAVGRGGAVRWSPGCAVRGAGEPGNLRSVVWRPKVPQMEGDRPFARFSGGPDHMRAIWRTRDGPEAAQCPARARPQPSFTDTAWTYGGMILDSARPRPNPNTQAPRPKHERPLASRPHLPQHGI